MISAVSPSVGGKSPVSEHTRINVMRNSFDAHHILSQPGKMHLLFFWFVFFERSTHTHVVASQEYTFVLYAACAIGVNADVAASSNGVLETATG